MDGQPAPERPSPLGDQPDGGSINKETVIHTVRRDIEHRINLLESPDTTASSDSGNIDEPGTRSHHYSIYICDMFALYDKYGRGYM